MSRVLGFFVYEHLDGQEVRELSRAFRDFAHRVVLRLPESSETEMALRKLLEARDCALRALLYG